MNYNHFGTLAIKPESSGQKAEVYGSVNKVIGFRRKLS
jgi:hypothetical protein